MGGIRGGIRYSSVSALLYGIPSADGVGATLNMAYGQQHLNRRIVKTTFGDTQSQKPLIKKIPAVRPGAILVLNVARIPHFVKYSRDTTVQVRDSESKEAPVNGHTQPVAKPDWPRTG